MEEEKYKSPIETFIKDYSKNILYICVIFAGTVAFLIGPVYTTEFNRQNIAKLEQEIQVLETKIEGLSLQFRNELYDLYERIKNMDKK